MSRKKKEVEQSGDLLSAKAAPVVPAAAAKPPSEPATIPAVLEYTPVGSMEKWRVEKFDLLAAEIFDIADHDNRALEKWMVEFHELAIQSNRGWLICRRLFGIGPLIPPADANPEDLHPHSREEICTAMGITTKDLQAELNALRLRTLRSATMGEAPAEPPVVPAATLDLGDDLLKEFGFDEGMFEVTTTNPLDNTNVKRAAELNRIERNWFINRVREWRRMLSEPMCGGLARAALMNELHLKRFEQEMSVLGPSSRNWKFMHDSKSKIEQIFKEQLESLQEMFPEAATSERETFRWTVSTLNQAHREFYGSNNNRLVDGVFTAAEIEVQLRQSLQMKEPKYRFGLSLAIVEATHNLYDPNFRSQFNASVLKKMDAGFKAAVETMRESMAEPLVDLEKGVVPGEGEDWPNLKEPEAKPRPK